MSARVRGDAELLDAHGVDHGPREERGLGPFHVEGVAVDRDVPRLLPATLSESKRPLTDVDALDPEEDDTSELEGPIRIQGQILRAGERTPVEGARILAIPAPPDLKIVKVKKIAHFFLI